MSTVNDVLDLKRTIASLPYDMRVKAAKSYKSELSYRDENACVKPIKDLFVSLRESRRQLRSGTGYAPMEKHFQKYLGAIRYNWFEDLPHRGDFDIAMEWINPSTKKIVTRRIGQRYRTPVKVMVTPQYLSAFKNVKQLHKIRNPEWDDDCYAIPTSIYKKYTTDNGIQIIHSQGSYWYSDCTRDGEMYTAIKHGMHATHVSEKRAVTLLNKRLKAETLARFGI